VHSWDVATLLGVSTMLAICALSASYFPARKASWVEPMQALRYE
jgi:ABC-type lipoprotein release transport system permease subunit